MTEFSIYQINTDRDNNRVCFLGLDTLERFQHSKEVDPVLYDRVYDGKLDCNSLETIYEKFNIDHPADYKGRDIEEYMPFEDEVAIICNEEGKITGMAPNRAVYEENSREMLDIICGKFFIVYAPFEAERFQSLPPDLAEKYREKFKYPERFMRVNNEIVAVPFKPVRADKER